MQENKILNLWQQAIDFDAVVTEIGCLHGRNCIYIDEFGFDEKSGTVHMIGEVSGSNCKPVLLETWCAYKLQFTGVLAVQNTDLHEWTWRSSSCFDRVIKSDWLASFGESVASGSTHFLVQTYDDVYDIVAKDFTFQAGQ